MHLVRRMSDFDATDDVDDTVDQNVLVVARDTITTSEQAYRHVLRLVNKQVDRAVEEHVPPTQVYRGDVLVRNVMYTLLSDWSQRRIYMHFVTQTNALPRIRHLFGAPPYHFLDDGEGGALRAGGFALGRKNMSYDGVGLTCPYTQFGYGQFVDADGRLYRVLERVQKRADDPLPHTFENSRDSRIVMQVRLKRLRRSLKLVALKQNPKRVTFPTVGERLTLTVTRQLKRIVSIRENLDTESELALIVTNITVGNKSGLTTTLLGKIV